MDICQQFILYNLQVLNNLYYLHQFEELLN